MEPRKEESKKSSERRKEARKGRFQIVKLEERIAPNHVFRGAGHGRNSCGHAC